MELHRFLLILDKETLSGNATIQKGLLADLLQTYSASNGMRQLLTGSVQSAGGQRVDCAKDQPANLL